MAGEVVTFETVLSKSKIDCYQCEKCGFIDTQSTEEFKAMPTEQQQFLMEHRNLCGGWFWPVEVVLKADVVALQTQLQELPTEVENIFQVELDKVEQENVYSRLFTATEVEALRRDVIQHLRKKLGCVEAKL